MLLLLLTTNFCFAQNFNNGDPSEIDFYEELRFEQINGKIIITVGIAGRLNKSLDTGAPFIISYEIAAEPGITSSKKVYG